MNITSSTSFMEALASLHQQGGPRALLVSLDRSGQFKSNLVSHGHSVLSIKDDLIDHLDSEPVDAAWLENLRDYCTARLAARQEAKATDGLSIHRGNVFSIEHANLFQPLN